MLVEFANTIRFLSISLFFFFFILFVCTQSHKLEERVNAKKK